MSHPYAEFEKAHYHPVTRDGPRYKNGLDKGRKTRLVFNDDFAVGEWVARRIPHIGSAREWGGFRAIGVALNDKPIAGAVYNNSRGFDMEISFAADSPRWANRGTIRGILAYPFIQCGCTRLTATIAKRNKRARRLVEGLGFKQEGCLQRGLDGRQDAILYGLQRENCRWIHG